ncbi:hemolysin family protein [Methylobrevis pamukkalensis]|uniref:Hemolysin C n=1 Tax=Methylobrevis pamukkalensis TaxID=1439726 RepID=A0A1E3H738_9HYPH|nr:hemolysin family protein [Methylobrevis pamukkalensis]ODN72147.1 Hemolysin C [Methylobrevis pamukkalensis]
MNDTDAQSSSAVLADEARSATRDGQGDAETRSSGGWLGRLRETLGLRVPANLRQDLEQALSREDALDAAFSPEERAMLRNILRMRETRVDDIMVPRADINAVDLSISLADLVLAFESSGHSRMPIFRETLDDPVGMVHIKDLMAHITIAAKRIRDDAAGPAVPVLEVGSVDLGLPLSATDLLRPILFVPPSMPASDLLAKMQATRIQIALVIDEYGGTDGLVSMEDIVETIVGDISDEHDELEGPSIVPTANGGFIADARASLEDVVAAVGPEFEVADYGDDVDTIGGMLFSLLGRIPVRGEIVTSPELAAFEIEVLEADPRRIRKVRISPRGAAQPAVPDRRKRRPDSEAPEQESAAE